jgi:hypothetical protein
VNTAVATIRLGRLRCNRHAVIDLPHVEIELHRCQMRRLESGVLDSLPADIATAAMHLDQRVILADEHVFHRAGQRAICDELLAAVRRFRARRKHFNEKHRVIDLRRGRVQALFTRNARDRPATMRLLRRSASVRRGAECVTASAIAQARLRSLRYW